ncbi:hypothetical protein QFC21_004385 [Naganishia friedmannii]|uniref:Uncharacterized protein n=1 Tax=Naganishia friedmannii TaxID=89922 RepID=A0ACC2VHG8_9TREE|nr:hypothetical protein QFC21_004385 [Naganishia friedmannii]
MKNKGGGMPLWPLLLLVTYLVLPVLASLNGNKPNSTIVDHDNNHTVSTPVASATTWSVYPAPTAILCTLDDSDIAAGSRLFCGTATAQSTITSSATSITSPTSTPVVPPVAGAPESAGRHARTYDDAYENLSDDDLIRLVSAFDSDPSAFQRADLSSRSAAKRQVRVDETLLDTFDSSCHPQAQRVAGFGIGPVRGYTVECALNREIVDEDRQPEPDPLHILAAILIERAEAYRRGEAKANSVKATAWSVSEASRKAKAVFEIEAAKVADTYQIQLSELEASRKQQAESDVVYAQNVKKQAALEQEWSEVNALKGELKEQVALAKSNVAETQKIRVRAVLAAFPENLAFEVPYAYSTTPTTGAPCLYQQLFSDPLSTLCNLQATSRLVWPSTPAHHPLRPAPTGDVLEVRQIVWLGIQKLYNDISVTATVKTFTVLQWAEIRFSNFSRISVSEGLDTGLETLEKLASGLLTSVGTLNAPQCMQVGLSRFSRVSAFTRFDTARQALFQLVGLISTTFKNSTLPSYVSISFPIRSWLPASTRLDAALEGLDKRLWLFVLLVNLLLLWMFRKTLPSVIAGLRNDWDFPPSEDDDNPSDDDDDDDDDDDTKTQHRSIIEHILEKKGELMRESIPSEDEDKHVATIRIKARSSTPSQRSQVPHSRFVDSYGPREGRARSTSRSTVKEAHVKILTEPASNRTEEEAAVVTDGTITPEAHVNEPIVNVVLNETKADATSAIDNSTRSEARVEYPTTASNLTDTKSSVATPSAPSNNLASSEPALKKEKMIVPSATIGSNASVTSTIDRPVAASGSILSATPALQEPVTKPLQPPSTSASTPVTRTAPAKLKTKASPQPVQPANKVEPRTFAPYKTKEQVSGSASVLLSYTNVTSMGNPPTTQTPSNQLPPLVGVIVPSGTSTAVPGPLDLSVESNEEIPGGIEGVKRDVKDVRDVKVAEPIAKSTALVPTAPPSDLPEFDEQYKGLKTMARKAYLIAPATFPPRELGNSIEQMNGATHNGFRPPVPAMPATNVKAPTSSVHQPRLVNRTTSPALSTNNIAREIASAICPVLGSKEAKEKGVDAGDCAASAAKGPKVVQAPGNTTAGKAVHAETKEKPTIGQDRQAINKAKGPSQPNETSLYGQDPYATPNSEVKVARLGAKPQKGEPGYKTERGTKGGKREQKRRKNAAARLLAENNGGGANGF